MNERPNGNKCLFILRTHIHLHLQHTHRHIYCSRTWSSWWLCMRQQFRYLSDDPLSLGLFFVYLLLFYNSNVYKQLTTPLSHFLDPWWRPIWTHSPKIVPKSTPARWLIVSLAWFCYFSNFVHNHSVCYVVILLLSSFYFVNVFIGRAIGQ